MAALEIQSTSNRRSAVKAASAGVFRGAVSDPLRWLSREVQLLFVFEVELGGLTGATKVGQRCGRSWCVVRGAWSVERGAEVQHNDGPGLQRGEGRKHLVDQPGN